MVVVTNEKVPMRQLRAMLEMCVALSPTLKVLDFPMASFHPNGKISGTLPESRMKRKDPN